MTSPMLNNFQAFNNIIIKPNILQRVPNYVYLIYSSINSWQPDLAKTLLTQLPTNIWRPGSMSGLYLSTCPFGSDIGHTSSSSDAQVS